ncbi:MAG: hypothetical protein NTV49_11975 [Kiritimatiellaeota bacterium]|nr:hypothetical protein [Kiritimatiellota bacterium]
MPPGALIRQLEQIGRLLNRWSAEIRLAVWAAAVLLGLTVCALADLWVRFASAGRIAAWLLLVVLVAVALWRLARTLTRVRTPEAVAVRVEQTFPQIDNHLINCLQFSSDSGQDPFKAAYVQMALPYWSGLDFQAMKDRRTQHRSLIALAATVFFLLLPFPMAGRAWTVALLRIVNPFSTLQPASLTHILGVTPGDASVLQGGSTWLTCTVQGKRGHEVWVDIKPSDAAQKTYRLGRINGSGEEVFSNRIYKATTALQYRFRAGDAPAPRWFTLSLRPPLAFTRIGLRVVPPSYTGARPQQFDGQAAVIDIPMGSRVELAVHCNAPCATLTAACREGAEVPLSPAREALTWTGALLVSNGAALKLSALSRDGDKTEAVVAFNLLPDRAPNIEISAPKGEVLLAPGSAPAISFTVTDDYGLDEITVQRVPPAGAADAPGQVLKSYKWITSRSKIFTATWKGPIRKLSDTEPLTLRLVAKDQAPGTPHVTQSPLLVFKMMGREQAVQQRSELEKKALADLNRVIELQRENIAKTKQYQELRPPPAAASWTAIGGRQQEIRAITKALLLKGARCLGNLSDTVKKLYLGEMAEVIVVLERVAGAQADAQPGLIRQALQLEEKIFRQLTFAEVAIAKASIDFRQNALIGMLDGLIKNQTRLWQATTQCIGRATAPAGLVKEQDGQAGDVTEFIKACQAESAAVLGADKAFAGFLEQVAGQCRDTKIREDMLQAAEQLDKSGFAEAAVKQRSAIAKLMAVRKLFDDMVAAAEKEKNEQRIEALQNANKKIEKIKALEKKLIEAMDAVKDAKDKDNKQADMMEEDFEEVARNAEKALLEVPVDLDIFADLNVGNDLVEDINSTFEEVRQQAGSEQAANGPVAELAVAKREAMLDAMEKAQDRMDELEYWLKTSPDGLKITTEPFDKEEMPNGVALPPLLTKVDDLIGDLLNESKEKQAQDKDGAINSAVPDMAPDGPVTEGDVTSFAAQGKSGNETPDHKEQDGRSNVGREGMSDGETAAGSGTLSKGDEDIQARRTQDPTQSGQVNLDGESKAKATGGGKLGTGKADEYGQGGGTRRMDSTEAGSLEAMAALMAKQADAAYAQASLKGVKSDSLKAAAHHMRQVADMIARGAPIDQVLELRRKALAELKAGRTELEQGNTDALDTQVTASILKDVLEAGPDDAPPKFKELVSEYYKRLNDAL